MTLLETVVPSLETRRTVFMLGAGLGATLVTRPALATPDEMTAAMRAFAGSATIKTGKVRMDIPPLVENGNSVPVSIVVDSPMTADEHVTAIAVFNEKNPQPNVAIFRLGPRSGRAQVATRIRLATTQSLTAIARLSDGSFWSHSVDVIVTIAACTEES